MDELNYGGMSRFLESHSLRLVKDFNHNVDHKEKFRLERQLKTKEGVMYSAYSKGYIVEPADG